VTVSSPTLALMPGPHPGPGMGASTGTTRTALSRAGDGYFAWLDHVWAAAGCSHPIRLYGDIRTIDTRTGELLRSVSTATMPDHVIYKACGNRRSAACPNCAETYRRDAYHVIRSGLVGGKGIPDTVATHPAVLATFTAPSFGPVHSRAVRLHTCADRSRCTCRPEPCHARRQALVCQHSQPIVCFARHTRHDPQLGQPLCPECYDYAAHAVWNNAAGELWRRTKQTIERHLARLARSRGLPPVWIPASNGKLRAISPVRVSHGKAAEFQARGAVHFHVLLRLDGIDPDDLDAIIPPPPGITVADLDDAVHHAATHTRFTTTPHDQKPAGWAIGWGDQTDVRVITMRGGNAVTDAMVAAYLAKYATKSTEVTGHTSQKITADTIGLYANPDGTHTERLIDTCWILGRHPDYHSLHRWAHMLGFGGHFLTKARRYSITFTALRTARIFYQRTQTTATEHGPIRTADHTNEETTLIIGNFYYAGTGWKTTGDALLANTAADQARRRRAAGREEMYSDYDNAAADHQAA
jgi:hypothetical protein